MSGLDFWIWVLLAGYVLSRWRIHKWQEAKRSRRYDSRHIF
jgi:hypothetical protein